MNKPTLSKVVCILFVFCAAMAIASPAQTLTTLHSFAGYPSDGANPWSGLVQASDGTFYGTTETGGASQNCGSNGCGTVFKITPSGTLTTLHSFAGYPDDGSTPVAGLVWDGDGNFYGTTVGGGLYDINGTVFKITPSVALTTLYSFGYSDGANPYAGLVQSVFDGNFYGTTFEGGANGYGTVFKITPNGTLTTLHSFAGRPSDGARPAAGLVQADVGFYGTTYGGGAYNDGTVFTITPSGALTTLYSFCSQINCADGYGPQAGLVYAADGNFYGTTVGGGANGAGTVFKITAQGALTTLYSFCSQSNCSDGAYPYAGLVQATDGNFYGTTSGAGGCQGSGTVFKMTSNGTLTTLHSFNCSDGATPDAGLVQATDGNFYGTTRYGGANGDGTVFRLVLPRACVSCRAVE